MEQYEMDQLIKNLTLEEKIGMIHGQGIFHTAGVKRLGIPALWMSDGPMGVRRELQDDNWNPKGLSDDYVSYLPNNIAIACTWNRDLAKRVGKVLGAEARGRKKDVILAPGINIIRSPLCGRNFEYMSEDPYLIQELAVPLIQGIQEEDTAACVKHFAANNQETRRLDVDVNMDERAFRELYLPGFEAAVKSGKSLTLMGAYNQLYGEYCCQSQFLLNQILRHEWNYDGVVISDWGGVHDTAAAVSGLDIEMSVTNNFDEYYMAQPLLELVEKGIISETIIDEKIRHILNLMNQLHMLDGKRKPGSYNTREHQEELLVCAKESVVLLKNEGNLLPLAMINKKQLAVIGENAVKQHAGGGGSAAIKALYEISPLLGLQMELGGNVEVKYAAGYIGYMSDEERQTAVETDVWQASSLEDRAYKKRTPLVSDTEHQTELLKEAVKLAKSCEDVVLFCGLDHNEDLEGRDRFDMKLPYGQDNLIEAILAANSNTVIVVIAGSPVDMERFADRARAIVYSSYNGMEGGRALAQILLGKSNPSGKLPFTIPKNLKDCPAHNIGEFPGSDKVHYREGIFVGYRYYETAGIPVRYPFGHGISYTEFVYENLLVLNEGSGYRVTVTIKNIGTCQGAETIQLYAKAEGRTIKRPIMELRGFGKIYLESGECGSLDFLLQRKDFSSYDTDSHKFVVFDDLYSVAVGSSVSDIRLTEPIVITPGDV